MNGWTPLAVFSVAFFWIHAHIAWFVAGFIAYIGYRVRQ